MMIITTDEQGCIAAARPGAQDICTITGGLAYTDAEGTRWRMSDAYPIYAVGDDFAGQPGDEWALYDGAQLDPPCDPDDPQARIDALERMVQALIGQLSEQRAALQALRTPAIEEEA